MEDYIEELLRVKELSEDVGEILDDYAQMIYEVEQWRLAEKHSVPAVRFS